MFVCQVQNENYNYKILKIDGKDSFQNIDLTLYSKCISNFNLPDFINKEIYSGCTVHYVNSKLDSGFIILKKRTF